MPIIIISSNSPEDEREIARKIIEENGYACVNNEILKEIEAKYAIHPGRLDDTLKNSPSFIKKLMSREWQYHLACIEAYVLDLLMKDKVVCWGVAAHLFVAEVSHALKIRIVHEGQKRIYKIASERDISSERARKWLDMETEKRKKWSMSAYNRDETDPSQYDLMINLDQIDLHEAVATIINAAGYRKFQPITYSIKCLSDLALAARVRTTLLKSMNDVRVQAKDGTVLVFTKAFKQKKIEKIRAIKELAGKVDGVDFVEVHVTRSLQQ